MSSTIPTQENENIIYCDSETRCNFGGKEYYTISGHVDKVGLPIIYIGGFPLDWALDHLPETGPIECANCLEFGCLRGVFIGYCANCADYLYNFTRGAGFIGDGTEYQSNNPENSAFETYLKGIDMTTVSELDVVKSNSEINNKDYIEHIGGPFNPDYEGGYNDF